jgi:hypothetical protein
VPVYRAIDDDSAWFFSCSSGHVKIISPRYGSEKEAERMLRDHLKRMNCE